MLLQIPIDLDPEIFYYVPYRDENKRKVEYHVLMREAFPADAFVHIQDYAPAQSINTLFSIGLLTENALEVNGGRPVGFIFHSNYTVQNLGTGILAKMRSNKASASTALVLRTDLFFVYHSPNHATLINNGTVSERINNALTSTL